MDDLNDQEEQIEAQYRKLKNIDFYFGQKKDNENNN